MVVWPGGLRTVSASGGAELGWDAFPAAVETPELFLFFFGGTQAVYLPKRLLDARQGAEVRAIVRERMGEKARLLG